jgi:hypothetical protein
MIARVVFATIKVGVIIWAGFFAYGIYTAVTGG